MPIKIEALVGFLPVLTFLTALLYLDSYRLLRLRAVVAVVVCGAVAAAASYVTNAAIMNASNMDLSAYSRYVAPLVEESLKGLIVVALIRTHRIGFLVDAAIFGFAAGTGFAMVENMHFLSTIADAAIGTWIVRGLGTAIMHGGATALFAVIGLTMLERVKWHGLAAFLPGLGLASALHSGFNHLSGSPRLATLATFLIVPLVSYVVFQRSERATSDWLGTGFDADSEMLALINSGHLDVSPLGRYLHALKDKFNGPIVADILCYLRLHTELAMRAKGILMMRQNGFDPAVDDETRDKFTEMRYLERAIGKTALLALQPMLHVSRKDLWQMYMLGK